MLPPVSYINWPIAFPPNSELPSEDCCEISFHVPTRESAGACANIPLVSTATIATTKGFTASSEQP